MSVECTSCGHIIPAGQFRCGKCGALSPRQSMEDFAGLTEVVADAVVPRSVPEAAVQEAVVPKGTFASEAPRPLAVAPIQPDHGEVHAASAPPAEPPPARSPSASTSQRILNPRTPAPKPPFLASDSLREDLTPREPGQRSFMRALLGAAGTGLVANAVVAFDDVNGWLCAALCAGLMVITRLKLDYAARARLVLAVAGLGLLGLVAARRANGAGPAEAVLAAACALLPSALWFRSWYRGARVARLGVAFALVLAFTWCVLTSHRGLLALEFSWQSWLPALAWYLFGILCLLALLAFMGDETTGGCDAWAIGISCWFGGYSLLRWALERDPMAGEAALGSARAAAWGLSEAPLAAVFALALAQVAARLFVSRSRMIPRAS
ncbi:MAG TPA: hypothetical protein VFZ61_05395 [Polyangiales bacterium]